MDFLQTIDPAHSLCFSGHRPDRLPGRGEAGAPEMQPLIAALRQELIDAVGRGITTMNRGLAVCNLYA